MRTIEDIPINCIQTYSGKYINPLDPDPASIDLMDIAHALSLINRFTGHTTAPMSVAQHSSYVSDLCGIDAAEGLLHDASEAYLADLARPIKGQKYMKFYRSAEAKLMEVIFDKYDLLWPLPDRVKEADNILLHSELRDFFGVSPNGHRTLDFTITPWDWRTSKLQFIARLRELNIAEVGDVIV